MTDEVWARGIERELGASGARQDATDASITRVASEMKDGFAKQENKLEQVQLAMRSDLARECAHIRGELEDWGGAFTEFKRELAAEAERREEEERERAEKLIAELKQSGTRARQINQYVFAALVLGAVGVQQILEHLPTILHFLGIVQ